MPVVAMSILNTLKHSLFFFTEACTIFHWSRLSDRIGRKPVFLVGLSGIAVSMYCFGLSKTFWGVVLRYVVRCLTIDAEFIVHMKPLSLRCFKWQYWHIKEHDMGAYRLNKCRLCIQLPSFYVVSGDYRWVRMPSDRKPAKYV